MLHDIGSIIGNVLSLYTPELLTARGVLPLIEATRKASLRTLEAVSSPELTDLFAEERQVLAQQLVQLRERLDAYTAELGRVLPNDPIPEVVRPLLYEILGRGPDFATPFSIDNQLRGAARGLKESSTKFLDDLQDRLEKAAKAAKESVKDIAKGAGEVLSDAALGLGQGFFGSALPWVIGGVVVVGVAGMTYAARRL